MTWQVLHHLVALRRMGFDVWYVEDADNHLFDRYTYEPTYDPSRAVSYVDYWLKAISLGDRWLFRVPMSNRVIAPIDCPPTLEELYSDVDAVLNVCGAHAYKPLHDLIKCRIYLQTDPVEEQVRVAQGDRDIIRKLDAHDYHFTYGYNLGRDECPVPLRRYEWRRTRPPVYCDWWQATDAPIGKAMTTIANWSHSGKDVVWKGKTYYWSKDREFIRFLQVPKKVDVPLEIAVGGLDSDDRQLLEKSGWKVISSASIAHPLAYQEYIENALGEFTAAKHQVVATNSGWFSDRSACFLASGLPVVTQETGFSRDLPVGRGLFAFQSCEEAVEALRLVASDPVQQGRAASDIAREYFAAERVLEDVLAQSDLS